MSQSLSYYSTDSHIISVLMTLLLCISADIHPNPGPLYTKSIGICHANVRSLKSQSKLDELKIMADSANIDIITLSETWLNMNDNDLSFNIPGFQKMIRSDRNAQHGGGVAVYCKDNINCITCPDLNSHILPADSSCLWIEIILNSKRLVIGTYYRPPGQNAATRNSFLESLSVSITSALELNASAVIVMGDFNDRCQTWHSDHFDSDLGLQLYNLIEGFGLSQIIESPTRITDNTKSLLDLVIVDSLTVISDSGILPPIGTSDHSVVFCRVRIPSLKQKTHKRTIWDFKRCDFASLNESLRMAPFDIGYAIFSEPEDVVHYWLELYKSTLKEFIPNKTVSIKSRDKPWITGEFKKLIRKRDRLWKRYKRTGNPAHYQIYKTVRNSAVALNRSNIKQYHDKLNNVLSLSTNPKLWWHSIKNIISTKPSHTIPPINHNDVFINSDAEKATLFNKYFVDQCKLPIGADTHDLPPLVKLTESCLEIPSLRETDILDILKELPSGKATGPDGIGNYILTSTAISIYRPMCKLFNYCLENTFFPSCWKVANVSPVHKKNEKMFCKNYRPISLLCNISKVFERAIYNIVYTYLTTNSLLNPKNAGFKKGDSTINQLLHITNQILSSMDQGKEVRMVFLDAAKAFDKVWHKGLLFKMKQLGISPDFVNWSSSYLSNRKQRVVINGSSSSLLSVEAGVPQGSILGPLLFLIYVNDITENIKSEINLFADDTSLRDDIVESPESSAKRLNDDLNTLNKWASQWLVTFNPLKTEVVTFSNKRRPTRHPPLYLNDTPLLEVNSHTHLGLTLNSDLSWSTHIRTMVSKASQRVNIMKRLKYLLSRKTLTHLYKSLIQPILEYGCIIFDNCTAHDSSLIEKVQYDAARVCTGAMYNTSKVKLLNELGWETLSERRKYFKLIMFHKIVHNYVPSYLVNSIPVNIVSTYTPYNLRDQNKIRPPRTRTNLYKKSFYPSTVALWNELPSSTATSPHAEQFKKALRTQLFCNKSPCFFSCGERLSQIWHTRLRLDHSTLNVHLFKYSMADSDKCSCGTNEDVEHYLLDCPKYAAPRTVLLTSIAQTVSPGVHYGLILHTARNYLLKLLLHGSPDLSSKENEFIFLLVHDFIKNTKRFDIPKYI